MSLKDRILSGESVLLDGPFEFGDQLRMPTSRWRKDKRPVEADSLSTIGAMLDALENPRSGES